VSVLTQKIWVAILYTPNSAEHGGFYSFRYHR